MNTEDLVLALSADTLRQRTVGQKLARAMPVAIMISITAFIVFWGPRPDIWTTLASATILKTVVPLGFALLASALAFSLAHPGTRNDLQSALLCLSIVLVAGTFGVTLVNAGGSDLISALSTPSLATCLLSIPILALPVLVAVLWALSSGAALRPRVTGAVAGLIAGGWAAAIYSIYCDKDMVLFVVPAYSVAVTCIAIIGALLGPRFLKW